ncbi:hypothetical protein Q31b_48510 [Novipirellula aureliae]|uniref:CcmD family protein n=1 Tax=Novipirellula aureliae TaxID=2527966 RepID=A0A5C6DIA2_9BACT|nr:hypothetical protein [Novipirellula aureliae]TWU36570.1 hypothetical protein Q31b_48510 [Novipirellula aureliae]
MIAQTSQLTISPAILLWMVFAIAMALLLFSAFNRRRSALTDALKAFVGRHDESARRAEAPQVGATKSSESAESSELANNKPND